MLLALATTYFVGHYSMGIAHSGAMGLLALVVTPGMLAAFFIPSDPIAWIVVFLLDALYYFLLAAFVVRRFRGSRMF